MMKQKGQCPNEGKGLYGHVGIPLKCVLCGAEYDVGDIHPGKLIPDAPAGALRAHRAGPENERG